MMSSPKPKVVLRSHDSQTARELRPFLTSWSDLHLVSDVKSIETLCKDNFMPMAFIVEAAAPSLSAGANVASPRDELMQFLNAARRRFPSTRRIVVSDSEDLSTTIHGLHTGAIDSLLHRPFDIAGVLTALRFQKSHANPAAAVDSLVR